MNTFTQMARLIHYLNDSHEQQPTLEMLANVAGVSPSHLQRQFVKWVGVSPKDFVQCLTVAHARALLQDGATVATTADNTGLSSRGRLHDLCIKLEAATPGELRNRGDGLTIVYGLSPTPFGNALVGQTERGICHLAFVDDEQAGVAALNAGWPRAVLQRDDEVAACAAQLFVPSSSPAPLRAWVSGSIFQVQVWRALLNVPSGRLMTYHQLAHAIGRPKAARAVGSAVAGNTLGYLIPCHRIIRTTGVVGEYRWGRGRKRALIAWESARERGDGSNVQ